MTRKNILLAVAIPVTIIVAGSLWLNYTHEGRILGLYTFAAFKAPLTNKITCAQVTNARVEDKFLLPLNFDQASKDALREYWHFSYFRECLFKAGYDFYGNKIAPTEVSEMNGVQEYKNYFADISLQSNTPITIVKDNVTNPDFDDYIIASQLSLDGKLFTINYDRSYKVKDISTLEPIFAGFESKEKFTSPNLKKVSSPRPDVLTYEDGNLFGYVLVIPNDHIVTIYGDLGSKETLESIVHSITILP